MSYVGKILIAVQVVMSLLFMAFAGAVYSMHQNWKDRHDKVQASLQATQANLQNVQQELDIARRDAEQKVADAEQRANQFQAQNVTLQNRVAQLQEQNNLLEQQRETQTGLAEAKANEARFRQDEAALRRIENAKLQQKLDECSAEGRDLRDQLATQNESYTRLKERYDTLLKKSAYLERTVAAHNLPTDPREIEKLDLPPPPVEGVITSVKKDKTSRPYLIEISIGSDDGLMEGHILDVVNRDRSKWLGQVRVVSVYPDAAVAEVILSAKNGIIQEGDDVTTRL